ncbi:MAG: hypothetical protein K6T83_15375 [Alicyclobacillus sp.]|nr:hypothetical protein [Alicyclobacillus sp.]
MLPIVSAALTIARAMQGLTILEVAELAGLEPDDVFGAENFLENVHPVKVCRIAEVLNVDLSRVYGV